MTSFEELALISLKSIDETLKDLLALSKSKRAATPKPTDDVALHVDLDSKYGDPLIKAKSPKDWTGPDMTGRHMSECPPDYLDLVATRLDYFAGKEADPTKKHYNELDAARARAWAARLRSGYQPKTAEPMVDEEQIKW
jgi:hypothetical protein